MPVRGGANVIESQSECPFRAVGRHRLRADPWAEPSAGLAPWERGKLLHAALAAFWRELRTQAALIELDCAALEARIAAAVGEGMSKLDAARARALPALVLATEPLRLGELIREWIDACDRLRPPFTVAAVERTTDVTLAGVALAIRIDRVDVLDDGGAAIIDYKSGDIVPVARWFDARPSATQLGVYALAWHAGERDTPLRAVAYAAVAADAKKPAGIAADAAAWPGLTLVDALPANAPADWPSLAAWWHDEMSALAREFATGHAAIDPRDRDVCKRCGMQSLCRIDWSAPTGDANDG
jgi:RecB family exonuclease